MTADDYEYTETIDGTVELESSRDLYDYVDLFLKALVAFALLAIVAKLP